MYRRGVLSGKLGHTLRSAPRRRGEQRFHAQLVEHREHGADRRRLAGAGAAREDYHLIFQRKLQNLLLKRRVAYMLAFFKLGDYLVYIRLVAEAAAAHPREYLRGVSLRLVKLRKIAGVAVGDEPIAYLPAGDERFDVLVHVLRLDADELRRRRGELFARDEAVAVAGIMLKLKDYRGADAVGAIPVNAHLKGEPVGLREAAADMHGGKDIRVIAQQLKRLGAVIFIHAHGEYRAQAERAHELHESAYPSLLAEAFRKLLRLRRAYALYLRQLLRRVFKYVQRLIAEFIDDERRRRGADAAHGSAREVFVYRGRGARQHTLRKLGLELPAVDAVRHPVAADDHGFAGRGVREAADDRHAFAVFVSQVQHGVAVLFIFIDHGIDRAGQL